MEDYKEYDDVAGNVPVPSDFTPVSGRRVERGWRPPTALEMRNARLAERIAALSGDLQQERATALTNQTTQKRTSQKVYGVLGVDYTDRGHLVAGGDLASLRKWGEYEDEVVSKMTPLTACEFLNKLAHKVGLPQTVTVEDCQDCVS